MNIMRKTDPFKKYWWVLLLIFGAAGGWICLPLLDFDATSATQYPGSRGLNTADQSLDSLGNPQGAPGHALDLSMGEGAYRKKAPAVGSQTSSLYQPPPEKAAPAPTASASSNLADALKAISRKSDPSGWSKSAREGSFSAPRGNFGGLSGLGSSGAGSSGSGANLALDTFGTAKPEVGMTATRGLGATKQEPLPARAMGYLKAAQSRSVAAAGLRSGDAAASLAGSIFDGSRGGSAISGGPDLQGGAYAKLDAVPMDLKPNSPDLNTMKYDPVPGAVASPDTQAEMMKQMLIAVACTAIGGLIGGVGGQVVSTVLMMSMMQSQQQSSNSTLKKVVYQPTRRLYGREIRYS